MKISRNGHWGSETERATVRCNGCGQVVISGRHCSNCSRPPRKAERKLVKYLRTTAFPRPLPGGRLAGEIVTTVVGQQSMTVPLEQLAADLSKKSPGVFFVNEISEESDSVSFERATGRACARQKQRESYERDVLAVCYYWTVMAIRSVDTDGLVSQTKPSPIPSADLVEILKQLAIHPAYDKHAVVLVAEDWTVLGMIDGKIAELGPEAKELVRASSPSVGRMNEKSERLIREVERAISRG